MTEITETDAARQPQSPKMQILAQFIKDISFENVLAQKGTVTNGQPNIEVHVNIDAKKRNVQHQFEVSIKLRSNAKSKTDNQTIFLLELDYAGLFHVEDVPEDQLHPFLLIECPRMLFPFLRRVVSDITRDGGFQPLNLNNIDFLKLYKAEAARIQAEETSEKTSN